LIRHRTRGTAQQFARPSSHLPNDKTVSDREPTTALILAKDVSSGAMPASPGCRCKVESRDRSSLEGRHSSRKCPRGALPTHGRGYGAGSSNLTTLDNSVVLSAGGRLWCRQRFVGLVVRLLHAAEIPSPSPQRNKIRSRANLVPMMHSLGALLCLDEASYRRP